MIPDTIGNILLILLIAVTIFGLALIPFAFGAHSGYRDGQIDALNGKIYYHLERQEDNSFVWVECPDVCDGEKKADEDGK